MMLNAIATISILGLLVNQVICDELDQNLSQVYCSDLNPQQSLDIGQIQGMWYGSEIIQHLHHKESMGLDDTESEVIQYNTCVVIHLAEVIDVVREYSSTTRPRSDELVGGYYNSEISRRRIQHYNFLKLIWQETDVTLEYTLRYNNSRRGFWLTSAPQEGSMLKHPYSQFTGTVQVMKAVGTHLVLSFCQSDHQLFSIILSRKPNTLTHEEIQSVRSLLKRRGLNTVSVRKVCRNNGQHLTISGLILMITFIIVNVRFFNYF